MRLIALSYLENSFPTFFCLPRTLYCVSQCFVQLPWPDFVKSGMDIKSATWLFTELCHNYSHSLGQSCFKFTKTLQILSHTPPRSSDHCDHNDKPPGSHYRRFQHHQDHCGLMPLYNLPKCFMEYPCSE